MHTEDKIVYKEYQDPVKYLQSTIRCANCEKEIVSVVEFPEVRHESTYVFICPCGGQSFKTKYENKVVFEPINSYIVGVDYPNKVNIIKLSKNR